MMCGVMGLKLSLWDILVCESWGLNYPCGIYRCVVSWGLNYPCGIYGCVVSWGLNYLCFSMLWIANHVRHVYSVIGEGSTILMYNIESCCGVCNKWCLL